MGRREQRPEEDLKKHGKQTISAAYIAWNAHTYKESKVTSIRDTLRALKGKK